TMAVNINTDTKTLLLMAGVGVGLYMWFNRPSVAQLVQAAADEAGSGLRWGAGAVLGAEETVANALWADYYNPYPYGAGNPQGFPPPADDPYYATWLAQQAGQPGVVNSIAPGERGPVGNIFRQFSPSPSPTPSPYTW